VYFLLWGEGKSNSKRSLKLLPKLDFGKNNKKKRCSNRFPVPSQNFHDAKNTSITAHILASLILPQSLATEVQAHWQVAKVPNRSAARSREHRRLAAAMCHASIPSRRFSSPPRAAVLPFPRGPAARRDRVDALVGAASRLAWRQRRGLQLARRTHVAALVEPAPPFPWGLRFAEPAPTLSPRAAVRRTHIVAKPATGRVWINPLLLIPKSK
jgi:hypothetical protein